jgi:hypothetical protein
MNDSSVSPTDAPIHVNTTLAPTFIEYYSESVSTMVNDPRFWYVSFAVWFVIVLLAVFVYFILTLICECECSHRFSRKHKQALQQLADSVKRSQRSRRKATVGPIHSSTYTIDSEGEDEVDIELEDNTIGFDEDTHEEQFHARDKPKSKQKKNKPQKQQQQQQQPIPRTPRHTSMQGDKMPMESMQSAPPVAYVDDDDDNNNNTRPYPEQDDDVKIELDLESLKDELAE